MTQPIAAPDQPRRGSSWDVDGFYYPSTEEREVPLTDEAQRLIFYLYLSLIHI